MFDDTNSCPKKDAFYLRHFAVTWALLEIFFAAAHPSHVTAATSESFVPVRTVQVKVVNGIPRIVLNGEPVLARFFWGAPGRGFVLAGPTGKEFTFDFVAEEDAERRGTIHFRFGTMPGTILIDAVRIDDLETGQRILSSDFENDEDFAANWLLWPPDERNTVAHLEMVPRGGKDESRCLAITLKEPPGGQWPDFHIYSRSSLPIEKGRRYRVSAWLRADTDRKVIIAIYRPGSPFVFLGGPPSVFQLQVRLAASAGVNFVSFPIPMPWPKPGEAENWSAIDAACREVIENNPNALLVPRIPMDPPAWWIQSHPDHAMTWDRGGQDRIPASVASPLYRQEAAKRLEQLVLYLEKNWGDHLAGYHPCGQNTGEWFYEDTWLAPLSDYSPITKLAWREWLTKKYGSDQSLQQAWENPAVALTTVEIPSPERRRSNPSGILHRPRTEQDLIDWAEFQQDMMAECLCHFAKTVRQASAGRKLVVFFYGYTFEFGAIKNGAPTSGHYALGKVLKSPDIDILCSPISYWDRGIGGSAPAMSAAETVMQAGKLWLFEDDTRTYLAKDSRAPGWMDGADTPAETQSLLLRNTAEVSLRHFGTWWMDLGATGWFADPELWKIMIQLRPMDELMLARGGAFAPAVAAIIDEKSVLHVGFGGDVLTRPLIYEIRRPLARMGTSYGQYLLEDVLAEKVPAKMLVFLAAWRLGKNEREQLRAATKGKLKIWCYAPGYLSTEEEPILAMNHLTGFDFQEISGIEAWAEPTERGRQLGLTEGFGIHGQIRPLFAVKSAQPEEVLATYPNGQPAVILRRLADGPSLFVGVPTLSSQLLRLAAREAGVHLITEEDANVYHNPPFLVIHGVSDELLELHTPDASPVWDYLTGQSIGRGPTIKLLVEKGETRILVYGDKITATPQE
ncbi:MAG: beta-galactosidase [Thermogutta sp.]